MNNREKELLENVKLCKSNNELNEESIGWSRIPLVECNVSGRKFRKKKWNYWLVTNEECLFSVTISNLDYAGLIFLYYLDFKTKKFIEKTFMTPFGKGCVMPVGVNESLSFMNDELNIQMLQVDQDTHLKVNCSNFNKEKLNVDLIVHYPNNHETMNVVIPWDAKTFQFTSKHQSMPTSGTITVGETTHTLEENTAFGCLDFGRGIWPSKIYWNWATGAGIQNNRRIGLNLGGTWTNGTGMTENAIVVDSKLTKISEDIEFIFDRTNRILPWKIKTKESNAIDLTFTPFFERIAKSNVIFVRSEVHQMIGHYSGTIQTEQGEIIELKSLVGAIEDHYAKW